MELWWIARMVSLAVAAPPVDDGYGPDPTEPLGYSMARAARAPDHERSSRREISLRLRALSVPRGILDRWYTDESDPDWAWAEERPDLSGTAIGLEYVVRGPRSNAITWLEYVDPQLVAGYSDPRTEPNDPLDGRYVSPRPGLGLVAAGLDYAYALELVSAERTGGAFDLALLAQGGLGIGVLAGLMDRWGPDAFGNPGYARYLGGQPPDRGLGPRVFPVVDLGVGVRATFGGALVWRVDVGLHTALSYGTSVGVVF